MGGNRINPEVSIEKWYNHVECVKKNTMLTSCTFYYTTGIKAFALHLSFCIFWIMFWSCIMLISLSCFSNMIKIFLLCSRIHEIMLLWWHDQIDEGILLPLLLNVDLHHCVIVFCIVFKKMWSLLIIPMTGTMLALKVTINSGFK